jgi:hypothetical protein
LAKFNTFNSRLIAQKPHTFVPISVGLRICNKLTTECNRETHTSEQMMISLHYRQTDLKGMRLTSDY